MSDLKELPEPLPPPDEERLAWMLLAPSLAVVGLVAIWPIAAVGWLALHKKLLIFGIDRWAGLDNFRYLASDPRFWNALGNTLFFTVESVTLELVLGLAFALLLHSAIRGRGLVRAAVLVPWAVPTVVSARMFEWIYNAEYGLANYALRTAGLSSGGVNWLGDRFWAMQAAIAVDVWKTTPFVALMLLAGLQLIGEELSEAARVDGAGWFRQLRWITLPLLKPAILVTLLFRALDAFRVFDAMYVLTGGGPADTTETLSIYTYKVLFHSLELGYGSALAVATFVAAMAISLVFVWLLSREGGLS